MTAILLATVLGVAACGWLRASGVSHTKPSGFVLRGYVTVAGAAAGQPGAACTSPAPDIGTNGQVRVTDPPNKVLAVGALRSGVLAAADGRYACNFPFVVPNVPGGHDRYSISVAGRPFVSFPATALREDKPAVIQVTG